MGKKYLTLLTSNKNLPLLIILEMGEPKMEGMGAVVSLKGIFVMQN